MRFNTRICKECKNIHSYTIEAVLFIVTLLGILLSKSLNKNSFQIFVTVYIMSVLYMF